MVGVQAVEPLNGMTCLCEAEQGQRWPQLLASVGWGCPGRAGAWQRTGTAVASAGGGEPEPGFSLVAFQCFKEMELTKGV